MDNKLRGESSSHRFSLRQVSSSQRSAVPVDPGCQRCQQCWIRRRGAFSSMASLSARNESVSGAFQTRSHPCL
jgi:hypothetical protein